MEAELYRWSAVRKRYLWQLLRYRAPMRRWERALDFGRPPKGALRELLRAAEESTVHYPRAFAGAGVQWRDLEKAEDLAHFPSLSRQALQESYYDLFHRDVRQRDVEEGWLGRTSGSTGEPVRFFMDADSIHFFTAFLRHLWRLHALGPLPRPGRAGVVLLCTLPRSAIYEVRLPLLNGTLFRKLHFAEPDADATLERLDPRVITGDPDSLARLLESPASLRPQLVLSSAFALPDPLARALEEKTGAVVVDYWSLAETGPIAWRRAGGPWTVLPSSIVECDHGELLVTNLRNRFFPLIRYRTGDLGEMRDGRLERLEGRVVSRFRAADGRAVDPSQLAPQLSALPVRQWQLRQEETSLRLRFYADAPLSQESTRELERAARKLLGEGELTLDRASAPLFQPGEKPMPFLCQAATRSASEASASSG
jgi:phenylacetate-CoA ligase